jgi:GMP reductase
VAEYRASEGKTVLKPYRGPVADCVLDVLGGLRSACTYTGARELRELPKRATFIRVTQQTNESLSAFNIPSGSIAPTPAANLSSSAKLMKMNDDEFCT